MEFSYTARDQTGSFVEGSVEASDESGASQALVGQGLTPVRLAKNGASLSMNISFRRGVPLMEKVVFARQLATMVGAGLPLPQALHILGEQTTNAKMKTAIEKLATDVEGGMTFGAALEKHPKIFDRIMVSMIKAGEVGGILDQILDRVAIQLEREHSLNGKIKGALIYPTVILIALAVMFILMMTMVIPQLTAIFQSMGTTLPLATRIVIAISNLFTKYAIFTGIAFVVIVIGWVRFIRTNRGRHVWHRILLKLPVVGQMSMKLNVARFTRTFGSLMAGGIPVVESLRIVSETSSNVLFHDELLEVSRQVETGTPISKALEHSPYYPALVKQMMAVGEETGKIDEILPKLAGFYEEDLDNMTKNLTSIIEPVLLLIIGAGVGFLVIAILMPIYSIQPK